MNNQKRDIIPKHGSFKVPTGYFEELQESIEQRLDHEEKKNPFEVPEGYFDQLKDDILKSTETPVIPMNKRLWIKPLIITVAASLGLFILINVFQKEEKCESFACLLNSSEIQIDDIQWIEAELVEEYYRETVEPLDDIEQDEVLIDYILENDWDVETLMEEDYQ